MPNSGLTANIKQNFALPCGLLKRKRLYFGVVIENGVVNSSLTEDDEAVVAGTSSLVSMPVVVCMCVGVIVVDDELIRRLRTLKTGRREAIEPLNAAVVGVRIYSKGVIKYKTAQNRKMGALYEHGKYSIMYSYIWCGYRQLPIVLGVYVQGHTPLCCVKVIAIQIFRVCFAIRSTDQRTPKTVDIFNRTVYFPFFAFEKKEYELYA
uniref:Uncharacterized protein n=1 Tax=Glossina brevipalpis TaxID=37001 RepID=A0A1A9WGK6_9MUSC